MKYELTEQKIKIKTKRSLITLPFVARDGIQINSSGSIIKKKNIQHKIMEGTFGSNSCYSFLLCSLDI